MINQRMILAFGYGVVLFCAMARADDNTKALSEMSSSITSASAKGSERAIRAAYEGSTKGFIEKDIDRTMAIYAKDSHIFDMVGGREETYQSLYDKNKALIDQAQVIPHCMYADVKFRVFPNVAYVRYIQPCSITLKNGTKINMNGRGTDLWLKRDGRWHVVDEHFSVPVDDKNGTANWMSTP